MSVLIDIFKKRMLKKKESYQEKVNKTLSRTRNNTSNF